VQGRKRIEGLFASHTLEDQQHYFDTMWDTRRWRSIFKIFFNKKVLGPFNPEMRQTVKI
jgi:S-adenosylmethionine-diacylglycerol 3-amino-3-carboxypropyl transferase